MEQEITARNLTVSASSREYISRKLERLGRHLNGISDAKVELKREATRSQEDSIVVQVTLNCGGIVLRGEERAATINAAVDTVTDVLDRRVRRLKGKLYRSELAKKTGRSVSIKDVEVPPKDEEEAAEELAEAEFEGVARTKRFPMKPMSVDEAVQQMEMLGHGFFFFFNVESGEYNVLYRRVTEGYGLLEPDLM